MKYKFKLWDSDLFSYEAAEKQLNEMAQCGYEFMHIVSAYIPLAAYKKSDKAQRIQYTIEIADDNDDDFFQLCKDAGWEKGPYIGGQQYIFSTKDCKAKPIFSDYTTKYENALKLAYEGIAGATIFFQIFMGLLLPFVMFYLFKSVGIWGGMTAWTIEAVCILFSTITITGYGSNYLFMRKATKHSGDMSAVCKPKWMKILKKAPIYFGALVILVSWVMVLWKNIFINQSVYVIVGTSILPVVAIAGAYAGAK